MPAFHGEKKSHHLPLPRKNTGTGDWDFNEFCAVR